MNRSHRLRAALPRRYAPRLLAISVLAIASLAVSVAAAPAGSGGTAGAGRPAITGAYLFTSGTASLRGGGHTWGFTFSETPSVGPRQWDVGFRNHHRPPGRR